MPGYLRITVTFLHCLFHGRADGGEPEWPPSPLRLFQSLVAASARRWNQPTELTYPVPALRWLETQPPPVVVTPDAITAHVPYRLYVPDNTADLLVSAWRKGKINKQVKRTEKDVRPMRLSGEAVHYLYRLADGTCPYLDILAATAHSITHLGWGIDMVVGDASTISGKQAAALSGHRWQPTPTGGTSLRLPVEGTLDDLMRKHRAFLGRLSNDGFKPVPPLRAFGVHGYLRDDQPPLRPYRVFELRHDNGSFCRYSQRGLIHIAGMVRHLTKEAMLLSRPAEVGDDWIETYVVGHACKDRENHRQFSYLPLPSIGHRYADQAVRRVMIAAPVGDDAWLEHMAQRLHGQRLKPEKGNEFGEQGPPILVRVRHDKVASCYTAPANRWASVTPVILPGHDDHKPAKTHKLVEAALAQSGIEQRCTFEWSPFSRFRNSLSAFKYDRNGRPTGYIRPNYLLSQTAVHMTLQFEDDLKVPGPLAIGAGRHCGLGLFAAAELS